MDHRLPHRNLRHSSSLSLVHPPPFAIGGGAPRSFHVFLSLAAGALSHSLARAQLQGYRPSSRLAQRSLLRQCHRKAILPPRRSSLSRQRPHSRRRATFSESLAHEYRRRLAPELAYPARHRRSRPGCLQPAPLRPISSSLDTAPVLRLFHRLRQCPHLRPRVVAILLLQRALRPRTPPRHRRLRRNPSVGRRAPQPPPDHNCHDSRTFPDHLSRL